MLQFPEDLSKAKILISNDDSIHAEGIVALEEIVKEFTDNYVVVAPETQQSATGHSLTIHEPLRIKKYDDKHYSVMGTPTDCVLLGISQVLDGQRPDLILSGINHGQNAADDVTYSGTVAAAIEATMMGIPSIALSQDMREWHGGDQGNWDVPKEYLPKIFEKLSGFYWNDNVLLNVNFPFQKHIKGDVKIMPVEQGHYDHFEDDVVRCTDPRGRDYYWIGPVPNMERNEVKTDMGALKAGHVTITPLSLNLTDQPTLQKLGEMF